MKTLKAFTLIELLIVVAIIAILAAIAVPNFLEAQTRSKVSRAKADMRSLATGLEAYNVDANRYPSGNNFGLPGARFSPNEQGDPAFWVLEHLSTPIAYISNSFVNDPFRSEFRSGTINPTDGTFNAVPRAGDANDSLYDFIKYSATSSNEGGMASIEFNRRANGFYILVSSGPDVTYPNLGNLLNPAATTDAISNNIYDPTNGTISIGSIFRVGGVSRGDGEYGHRFFTQISATD